VSRLGTGLRQLSHPREGVFSRQHLFSLRQVLSGVQPRLTLSTVNEQIDPVLKSFQDRRQRYFVCPCKCPPPSSGPKLESSLNRYTSTVAAMAATMTEKSGVPRHTSPQHGKVPTPEEDRANVSINDTRRRIGNAKILAKGRPILVDVNIDCLQPLFHLPQPEMAQKLGMSLTRLKRMCRRLELQPWPSAVMSAVVSEASHERILSAESELTDPKLVSSTPTSVFNLPGLLIIGLQMCVSISILILVPVKVVSAFFSSEPPWCASLPDIDDPSCRRPSGSFMDRQNPGPNQTPRRRSHELSTASLLAVDALFFDFSV